MTTTSHTPTVEEAVAAISAYLRPGFAEAWRTAGKQVGFKKLGRALREVVIPETNGHQLRTDGGGLAGSRKVRSASRPQSKEVCLWGRSMSRSGNYTRNRWHRCGPECRWAAAECFDWLNATPYPGANEPPRFSPGEGSCECGKSSADHWESATDDSGFMLGMRFVPCEYRDAPHEEAKTYLAEFRQD